MMLPTITFLIGPANMLATLDRQLMPSGLREVEVRQGDESSGEHHLPTSPSNTWLILVRLPVHTKSVRILDKYSTSLQSQQSPVGVGGYRLASSALTVGRLCVLKAQTTSRRIFYAACRQGLKHPVTLW